MVYLRKVARVSLIFVALMLISPFNFAHGVRIGDIFVNHPYTTPTAKAPTEAIVFFRGLENKGASADRLVAASSEVATGVVFQKAQGKNWVDVPAIALPAFSSVNLTHDFGVSRLKLTGLKEPLVDGDQFELKLQFDSAGTQDVTVWVLIPKRSSKDHKH